MLKIAILQQNYGGILMMNKVRNIILVITNRDDPHADYVIPILEQDGNICVFRFNTDEFPGVLSGTMELGDLYDFGFKFALPGGREICANHIKSVWYRRPTYPEPYYRITSQAVRQFIVSECQEFLENAWLQLPVLWVNHPLLLRRASRKIEQLRIAREIGWHIPPTVVTNNPTVVREFIIKHKAVVAKTLNAQFIVMDNGDMQSFFTRILTDNDIKELDQVAFSPCVFQKVITKKLELRITVIGKKVFAAAIDSQKSEATSVDWRRDSNQLGLWNVFILPPDIIKKSVDLVYQFNLHFASMDVILTPDNEFVFLDLNPNGQWLWVELVTGMPLVAAMVDLLSRSSS